MVAKVVILLLYLIVLLHFYLHCVLVAAELLLQVFYSFLHFFVDLVHQC